MNTRGNEICFDLADGGQVRVWREPWPAGYEYDWAVRLGDENPLGNWLWLTRDEARRIAEALLKVAEM